MKMQRCVCTLFMTVLCCASVFAGEAISRFTSDTIDTFMNLRIGLSSFSNYEALEKIDAFEAASFQELPDKALDFDQEKLILESLYAMERYNYLFDYEDKRPGLRVMMKEQMKKNEAWFEASGNATGANKWMYMLTGDVTSCYMTYSVPCTLLYGLHVKKLYQNALKQDSLYSYGCINWGQWLFFAPRIFGGGKNKALKSFENALKGARNDGERYFALIFLSQLWYDKGNTTKYMSYLNQAATYNPTSRFIETIRRCNEEDISLFQYNRERSGVDTHMSDSEMGEAQTKAIAGTAALYNKNKD